MDRAKDDVPSSPGRLPLYGGLNLAFALFVIVASAVAASGSPRLAYLVALFAICSTPALWMKKLNGEYALYTVFMFMYFMFFGALDLASLVSKSPYFTGEGLLTPAEIAILLGGVCFILGYRNALAAKAKSHETNVIADWPARTVVIVGLLLWLFGTGATYYWSVQLTVRSGEFIQTGSQTLTTLLMIGRYVQPLGMLLIAYAYTVSRSRQLLIVVTAVACLQVVLGFVSNTKGGAMQGLILIILTSVLVHGRVPKGWSIASVVFIVLAWPVFQTYRAVVVGEQGISNAEAARDIGKVLELSLSNVDRVSKYSSAYKDYQTQSFIERTSVKSAVDMIVSRTGGDVPYQFGYTLLPLLTIFIPRILWPTKLDVQAGQVLNHEFHVTDQDVTYISPSHLGEMYWNFGSAGVVVGMFLVGFLLGWINRKCDLSTGCTVTKTLVLAVTIFLLCIRFEASIATEYAVWLRSVVALLLLHVVFARRRAVSNLPTAHVVELQCSTGPIIYPNLMR